MEATARRIQIRERPRFVMSLAERLLLDRLRERDEDAFAEIVNQHGNRVFNLVLRMVGNPTEAEDIAQEVFVTVWKSIESYRGEAKFSTWLLRIAANHAKNRIKYLARRATVRPRGGDAHEDGDSIEAEAIESQDSRDSRLRNEGPDKLLEAAELGSLLERAIAGLDEEQRLIVILRDVEELSYEEICQITSLPEGTVKSRLHRARMVLKTLLESHTR